MSESKLMNTLRRGLERAHRKRGELAEISKAAGLSKSTVIKVKDGNTPGILAPNLEKLWCVLADRGHLDRTFEFPMEPSVSGEGDKNAA
jgi:DNA-binding Xre family transcriptional regulator